MSIIYKSTFLYRFLIMCLYRASFTARYDIIIDQIKKSKNVLDVCCGDCFLSERIKQRKFNIEYLGLEMSDSFVRSATKKNINIRKFDLLKDDLPESDVVVLMGSLYQFMPHEEKILQKCLASAKNTLIISEPYKNFAQSKNPIIKYFAIKLTNLSTGKCQNRFNATSLKKLYASHNATTIIQQERDMVGIWEKV